MHFNYLIAKSFPLLTVAVIGLSVVQFKRVGDSAIAIEPIQTYSPFLCQPTFALLVLGGIDLCLLGAFCQPRTVGVGLSCGEKKV